MPRYKDTVVLKDFMVTGKLVRVWRIPIISYNAPRVLPIEVIVTVDH